MVTSTSETATTNLSTKVVKKRRRRTDAQTKQLERQIYEVLAMDHPQSLRHVFYRMTDPRLPEPVDKTEAGYRQVMDRLIKMRRSGEVPYNWLADAGRKGYHVNTYRDRFEYAKHMARFYRADLWQYAEHYVEVWVESESLGGTVREDCKDLAVSLYAAKGFSSLTQTFEASEEIWYGSDRGLRSVEIIYIGDYDPAGVLIPRDIERKLRGHLDPRHKERWVWKEGEDDTFPLNFHRIAVTEEQIAEMGLPTRPRKKGENRVPEMKLGTEAETIPVAVMRQLLRNKIESFLPHDALRVTKIAEEDERRGILAWGNGGTA